MYLYKHSGQDSMKNSSLPICVIKSVSLWVFLKVEFSLVLLTIAAKGVRMFPDGVLPQLNGDWLQALSAEFECRYMQDLARFLTQSAPLFVLSTLS